MSGLLSRRFDEPHDDILKVVVYRKTLAFLSREQRIAYVPSLELLEAFLEGSSNFQAKPRDGETIQIEFKLRPVDRPMSIDFKQPLPSYKLFEPGDRYSSEDERLLEDDAKPPDDVPVNPEGELPSTAEKILKACPRFRILTGVGKSSLINRTFGVSQASVSEDRPGAADINFEITSDENDRVVVHDSKGFESGKVDNVDIVNEFIKERSAMSDIKDQLHAIWLCTEIPATRGRVFERGDEHFLKGTTSVQGSSKIPIIVVFTKYDRLVRNIDYDMEDDDEQPEDVRQKIVIDKADQTFQEDCIDPLHAISPGTHYVKVSTQAQYRHLLQDLVETTFDIVKERVSGVASYVVAMSQRIDSEVKIDSCIAIGRKRYWKALCSTADFPGKTLKACLDVLHKDIVLIWNFDDDSYLLSDEAKGDMVQLLADVRDREPSSPMKSLTAIGPAVTAVASATAAVPFAAPIVIPIAVVLGIATWAYQLYQRSHETLRCLMCYIIDLTYVMRQVFETHVQQMQKQPDVEGTLRFDPETFKTVLTKYDKSGAKLRNHTTVRNFVDDLDIFDRFSSTKVINKIEELIRQNDS
ncbi:hypothetical protein ONZ45_g5007 [Pleurotus djamor]|nr:hypothetical protein ONZ45_g5007 [Pleurotus djamor]